MELANLQLAELEAYDRMLDGAVERAIATWLDGAAPRLEALDGPQTLSATCARSASTWRGFATSCRTSPSSSATGTWPASTRASAARFHLADWHRTIDEKLKTLDDLYQLLQADQNNRGC